MRFDRLVLIAVLLVLPVAFWPGSTSYDPAKFTMLAVAGAFWLGHLAWRLAKGRPIPHPPRMFLIAGVALLAVMGVSALGAPQDDLVLRTSLLTALWLMVAFQTAVLVDSATRMRTVLSAAVVAGVGASLYGLAQIAGILPGAPEASGYPPGISTLGNQNYLSGLAAVLLGPSIILWSASSGWRRTGAVTATIVFVLTIVFAKAMGPLFGVIGSLFLVGPSLVLVRRGKSRRVPLVLGSSLLLTGILGTFLLSEAMRPPPPPGNEPLFIHRKVFLDNHGALRRTDWLVAQDMFRQSPLTGLGAGNYAVMWPATRARLFTDPTVTGIEGHEPLAIRAHNEVFQFLGETGLLGGLWLLVAGIGGAWFWRRRWRSQEDDRTHADFLLLTASLFVAAIHATVSFPLHLPATALMLAVVVGFMLSPAFAGHQAEAVVRKGNLVLAILPAALALILLAGSVREFVGDLHLATGKRFFTAGNLIQADRHLSRGIALCRWPQEGFLYHGLTRMAAGDNPGAHRLLTASLAVRPTFEGYLALAEIQIEQGKFEDADRNLTLVEDCEPFMSFRYQAAYLRGLAELRQDHLEPARLRFQELLKLEPDNQRAWLALGYLKVLEGNPGQARVYYGRALEIIDRKLGKYSREPGPEARGMAVRLKEHRQAAVKALESVS
jgi:O-antigen ligase